MVIIASAIDPAPSVITSNHLMPPHLAATN